MLPSYWWLDSQLMLRSRTSFRNYKSKLFDVLSFINRLGWRRSRPNRTGHSGSCATCGGPWQSWPLQGHWYGNKRPLWTVPQESRTDICTEDESKSRPLIPGSVLRGKLKPGGFRQLLFNSVYNCHLCELQDTSWYTLCFPRATIICATRLLCNDNEHVLLWMSQALEYFVSRTLACVVVNPVQPDF